MTAKITTLIDGQDNFEIIRDQIAGILLVELEAQRALAHAARKEGFDWDLRVFTEASRPWDAYQDSPSARTANARPIVNIIWDNASYPEGQSNAVERQKSASVYHIDCYGYGISKDASFGQEVGDAQAALEAQRAYRLVRNILMSGQHTYLLMRGIVESRWPQSAQSFQPQLDNRAAQNVLAVRLTFLVKHNELSPQYEPQELEQIYLTVCRQETGEVLLTSTVLDS